MYEIQQIYFCKSHIKFKSYVLQNGIRKRCDIMMAVFNIHGSYDKCVLKVFFYSFKVNESAKKNGEENEDSCHSKLHKCIKFMCSKTVLHKAFISTSFHDHCYSS